MAADVGSKAPVFTLMDQDRQPVKLSEQKGKPVVLAFFPAAFSSVCTKELCTFRDSLSRLNRTAAQVYGISVDTFFALKAFHDQQGYTFPLLSDFNKQAIRDYGVFNEDMIGLKGIAKRAVFVIDKEGVVRHREVLEDARNEPDYEAVFRALDRIGQEGTGQRAGSFADCPSLAYTEHMSIRSYVAVTDRVKDRLLDDQSAAALAETFKVLGDPTRVRILDALARAEVPVCDLAGMLGLTQSAVSHQLRLLRSMRLVRSRREGRHIYYTVDDDHIAKLFKQGLEHVQERR
jgi:peroxiredoxin/DNA-binding transcriptional ArsR family regulator